MHRVARLPLLGLRDAHEAAMRAAKDIVYISFRADYQAVSKAGYLEEQADV